MTSRGGGYRGGRGGRNARSTQPKGLFADGIWHCNCNPRLPAEHFKVKKEGKNQGRWFYTCQQGEPKRCDFFLWDEDAKPREEAAVLSNSRTEPSRDVQDGWNAGRGAGEHVEGRGLFARDQQRSAMPASNRDASTASPSPPPAYSSLPRQSHGSKRTAQQADMEDGGLGGWTSNRQDIAYPNAAGEAAPQTPHKAQKTGVYATPTTMTAKRKLPWLEEPTTPGAATQPEDYFATPSKAPASFSSSETVTSSRELQTPAAPHTLANAQDTPSPTTRFKDALVDPADQDSSLTSELLAVLSSVHIPSDTLSKARSILSKHDLKTQGIVKGRDISRLALKAKDAKIAELQARIASLEADMEVERGMSRMQRWERENRRE